MLRKQEIRTERLLLRPVKISDLNERYKYTSDREHIKYMIYLPNETKEDCRIFLKCAVDEWQSAKLLFYEFTVMLNDNNIGGVSVYVCGENSDEGELGWVFDKDFSGFGYATEAAHALVSFCKDVLHLSKLTAHCDSRNKASENIMKKIGMLFVCSDNIRHYPKRNEYAAETMYELYLK